MIHGIWKTAGRRTYRGHAPSEPPWEASIPATVAARAINRGDLALLEEFVPSLPPEFSLPEGWLG